MGRAATVIGSERSWSGGIKREPSARQGYAAVQETIRRKGDQAQWKRR